MSCLFIAIGSGVCIDHKKVRSDICDYLDNDGPMFDDLNSFTLLDTISNKKQYIDRMRKNNTWGGGIEIRAACEVYKINICVHFKKGGELLWKTIDNCSINTIHLHYNGSHYTFSCIT
jgi:hypothetical protein